MTAVVVFMVGCLVLAAIVLAWAAFPHRGDAAPGGRLTGVLQRMADIVPVVDEVEADPGRHWLDRLDDDASGVEEPQSSSR